MTSRVTALCVVLSTAGVACLNTSMPRSRQAVLDGVVTAAPVASAAASVPAPRVERAPDVAEVEVLPVAGTSLGRIRATVMVRAAAERVRAVLLDVTSYPEFIPNYKSAQVLGKTPEGATQVRMEIDALSGMIRRWMKIEISPPTTEGPRQTYDVRMLEGDVKAFAARWELTHLVDGTRLTLESFLDANVTLPSAFINAGSVAALRASILAMKARAEDGAN